MDLSALSSALRGKIQDTLGGPNPVSDCVTCDVELGLNALIPLIRPTIGPYAEGGEQDLPDGFKTTAPDALPAVGTAGSTTDGVDSLPPSAPCASVFSILTIVDRKERSIVQRAASRGIVTHVETLDGYKYCFNNAWSAKDEDGLRFSYICQDSMQNKDRHANGFARTQKHLKSGEERGPRKPTYDCRGTVSVKFSAKLSTVSVQYKHYALHSTAAQRVSLPRPIPFTASQQQRSPALKRKREDPSTAPSYDASPHDRSRQAVSPQSTPMSGERPLSLFELLQQSAMAQQAQDQPADTQQPWWGGS